jgi:two-component system chemotaxis response regulator CheB
LINLINKVKIAANSKVLGLENQTIRASNTISKFDNSKIIAIGSSTGGTEALYKILKEFPSAIPGIVIVQHIPPVFSRMFAERMNNQTALTVKEAKTGDYIEPGVAFVAPGDKHMRIKRIGDKYKLEVFEGDKVNGHCPSVDVLFNSVAKECAKKAIGVILTGMGHDGAEGLLNMKQNGSFTLGQDEKSSVVYGMPKAAFELGAVEQQLPLASIAQAIMTWARQ